MSELSQDILDTFFDVKEGTRDLLVPGVSFVQKYSQICTNGLMGFGAEVTKKANKNRHILPKTFNFAIRLKCL